MKRQGYNDKFFVMGIDGLDPSITTKYLKKGILPNIQKFLDRGAAAKGLVLLGGHPTITPPMWTTLATGAYPSTHGITDFWMPYKDTLDWLTYGLDSRSCKAEQLWNVTAESGIKTLVWHWPGSAWPPSSDSPNLHVVDGTQPEGVNCGTGTVEKDFILLADVKADGVMYQPKAVAGSHIPCTIDDLKQESASGSEHITKLLGVAAEASNIIITNPMEGQGVLGKNPYDVVLSPIKPASGWANAPEDAMEFVLLMSAGLIHRVGLILKNEQGVYDSVQIYKNKKSEEPIATLHTGEFVNDIRDEGIKNDVKYECTRNMRILDLSEDGTHLRMWVSTAMNINDDLLWHPKELHKIILDNCGPALHGTALGGYDERLMKECMVAQWGAVGEWQSNALNYLMDNGGYKAVFSHFHNIDLIGHMMIKYMKDKGTGTLPEHVYEEVLEMAYVQADEYVGKFMHYLDEGWTIYIVSDHGQACPEYGPLEAGEPMGVNVGLMRELGYTELKKDANGNDLHEIDWEKTRAIQQRSNHIYINLKGRNPHGIVDPADQYELEEQIMTDLYSYKHPVSGKRAIALALRNRDAILLGCGGEMAGDIIFMTAEGYHFDHGDCLSTTVGYGDTSVSAIFMAAGPGIKENFITDRVIREVDVVPTIAVVAGVRMPAQCEGAPAYQILSEEF